MPYYSTVAQENAVAIPLDMQSSVVGGGGPERKGDHGGYEFLVLPRMFIIRSARELPFDSKWKLAMERRTHLLEPTNATRAGILVY